jgi:hypothetical protein
MRKWHLMFLIAALGAGVGPWRASAASGEIAAHPNPCQVRPGRPDCTSHITWSTNGVARAKVIVVHQGAQGMEESNFGDTLSCESERCRAPWIRPNTEYVFTLYDFSSGHRGPALASVTVTATQ